MRLTSFNAPTFCHLRHRPELTMLRPRTPQPTIVCDIDILRHREGKHTPSTAALLYCRALHVQHLYPSPPTHEEGPDRANDKRAIRCWSLQHLIPASSNYMQHELRLVENVECTLTAPCGPQSPRCHALTRLTPQWLVGKSFPPTPKKNWSESGVLQRPRRGGTRLCISIAYRADRLGV